MTVSTTATVPSLDGFGLLSDEVKDG